MTFDSIDTIVYTAYFLIPGFVIAEVTNAITPGKRRTDAEKVIVYLGYSILNFACWFWTFNWLGNRFENKTSLYWLLLILLILSTAFITGCVVGFMRIHNPIRWLMGKLKISYEHPIPTAWEYKFSQMDKGEYLTVCLDDGTVIRGAFFNRSLASSDIKKTDIFLEEAYMFEDGKWKAVEGSAGVWISSTAIKWISFLTEEEILNDR